MKDEDVPHTVNPFPAEGLSQLGPLLASAHPCFQWITSSVVVKMALIKIASPSSQTHFTLLWDGLSLSQWGSRRSPHRRGSGLLGRAACWSWCVPRGWLSQSRMAEERDGVLGPSWLGLHNRQRLLS